MKKYWHLSIERKKLESIILTITPPISIFFMLRQFFLDQILETSLDSENMILFVKGLYLVSLSVSALVGCYLLQNLNRKNMYIGILIFRLVSIAAIIFLHEANALVVSCLLGASFGVGFPQDLAFLSDNTLIEERGKVSGLCLFSIFMIVLLLMVFSTDSVTQNAVISFGLQLMSAGVLFLDPSWKTPQRSISVSKVLENRTFMVYMIPWTMFSFVNGAVGFLWQMLETYTMPASAALVQALSSIIFFIIAGIIADYYGRKPALIIGFVMLGFSYFLVPSVETLVIDLIVSALSGIAWSFIMVSFLFTIVGDLSPQGSRSIYYAISGLIWMIIETGFTFYSSLFKLNIPISIVSSILSLAMFISIIPLLSAPETLPQNKISDRRISNYFEKVLRTIEDEK